MAMAALRREGRRFATPLISPRPIAAIRSPFLSEYELFPLNQNSPSDLVLFIDWFTFLLTSLLCLQILVRKKTFFFLCCEDNFVVHCQMFVLLDTA